MKSKLIISIFMLFSTISFTQISELSNQNIPSDSSFAYKLFFTQNMYTFIKLNTRNGQMWQVQWSTKGSDYRYESTLSDILLVNKKEEKNGRFILYPTTNMYNFVLLDQIDGRAWQVQWSIEAKDRMILRIY